MRVAYQELLEKEEILPDKAQEIAVDELQRLADVLAGYQPYERSFLFFRKVNTLPKGLYIYGDVGRGKSMLMDLFYQHVPYEKKRRIHFHAFMIEVHQTLHRYRKEMDVSSGRYEHDDPVAAVARNVAEGCTLLCLDELQITDIGDAMIVGRLFEALFDEGVVIVITSNRHPNDLYKDGLQRDRFLPFIDLIQERLQVHELRADQDYRLAHLQAMTTVYQTAVGVEAERFAHESFATLTNHAKPEKVALQVQGRDVHAPYTAAGVALFDFKELCDVALGSADYIAVSQMFNTLILKNIPKMGKEMRNEAKRFITLIDALYEHKAKLICTAEVLPHLLYTEGSGAFEFQRTVSRLMEMQSEQYLALEHEGS